MGADPHAPDTADDLDQGGAGILVEASLDVDADNVGRDIKVNEGVQCAVHRYSKRGCLWPTAQPPQA
ncbi:hypothetical protein ARTHRO9AX_30067 [Arthrobacter sp. 9AX]|nr:hypothetical protein ARTHRO9AX_30067 [Arthrobacter sp. 9AX]